MERLIDADSLLKKSTTLRKALRIAISKMLHGRYRNMRSETLWMRKQ